MTPFRTAHAVDVSETGSVERRKIADWTPIDHAADSSSNLKMKLKLVLRVVGSTQLELERAGRTLLASRVECRTILTVVLTVAGRALLLALALTQPQILFYCRHQLGYLQQPGLFFYQYWKGKRH